MTWLSNERDRLTRFRQGDRAVLAEVYAHYAPQLAHFLAHGFCVESGGTRFSAPGIGSAFELDDVIQETFLKAFSDSSRQAYDGVRPFGAWLTTIARHLVIDRYRCSSKLRPLEATSQSESEEISPENAALNKELSEVYARFMEGLNEKDRLVVKMRFVEQASRREVSEKTGYSAMQVRLREAKLRRHLSRHLREHGWEGALTESEVFS